MGIQGSQGFRDVGAKYLITLDWYLPRRAGEKRQTIWVALVLDEKMTHSKKKKKKKNGDKT
jgi:hypothetical protein